MPAGDGFDRLFKPLTLEDKPVFDRAFQNAPPEISEYTFTNLFAWRQRYGFEWAGHQECILLRTPGPAGYDYWPVIGGGDALGLTRELLAGRLGRFIRVPESVKNALGNDPSWRWEPDPADSDYVYAVSDLIGLKGRHYDGKRNLIRKFKSQHAYEYLALTPELAAASLSVEELWCLEKDCDESPGLAHEREAIKGMLEHFELFKLRGGAIREGGRLVALALAEALNPQTLVMHVLKALPDLPGLYQTLHQEFLAREAAGFAYVNLEQDLGLPGLRRFKESYHPVKMINKYVLNRKNELPLAPSLKKEGGSVAF